MVRLVIFLHVASYLRTTLSVFNIIMYTAPIAAPQT